MDNTFLILWIVLAIIFSIIEAATAQIVTIWFAIGSLGAIVANLLNINELGQFIIFVILSVVSLIVARPFLKKFTKTQIQPTNADMCIGKQAIVTEEINNTLGKGQAVIRGAVWSARSANETIIPVNTTVTVEAIKGVMLIVKVTND